MGVPVLILGESGSGKSTSLRNFSPDELVIYNVAGKPLPFRSGKDMHRADNATYRTIFNNMAKHRFKTYVIDDSQYLLAFEMFNRSAEIGYTKFTEMAKHFYDLIQFVIQQMPPDTIVYFLHHCEVDDFGKVRAKTIGKMLNNQLTVEGLFSIVLFCQTDGKMHEFITQSDGFTTAKSPMGMFELKIDNDLKLVDKTIREYYNITTEKEKKNDSEI